jgi:6-pyruvoyltetrahydropterin/6-carboxytetrahydropterin synthase|tara:strand:+ start:28 stop:480 length:453 start_codon:yes stop_codon:yes gene_type:complete
MKTFQVIKTFGSERGFSCAFRQWRADSNCKLIHGYSLGFKFTLEASELDEKSWVYDFGGFSKIQQWIKDHFDHTLVIAKDDPKFQELKNLDNDLGIAKVIEMNDVGCEKFAEVTFEFASSYIQEQTNNRVKLISVEVFEHGANSAVVKDI